MFSTVISPYLNCFKLFETNLTQTIRPINSVYHSRLITPRLQYVREIWKRSFTLKTHQMFLRPRYARKTWKSNNPGHFGLEENSGRKGKWLSWCDRFGKALFWEFFYWKCKTVYYSYFPYLNCFTLFEANVTQSIRKKNSVYHARLRTPRPRYATERNLKTALSLWKHIKCFQSTLHWRNLKKQQSSAILHFCLRKTGREITWLSCCHSVVKLCFERFIFKCTNVFHRYFPISQLFYPVWN